MGSFSKQPATLETQMQLLACCDGQKLRLRLTQRVTHPAFHSGFTRARTPSFFSWPSSLRGRRSLQGRIQGLGHGGQPLPKGIPQPIFLGSLGIPFPPDQSGLPELTAADPRGIQGLIRGCPTFSGGPPHSPPPDAPQDTPSPKWCIPSAH